MIKDVFDKIIQNYPILWKKMETDLSVSSNLYNEAVVASDITYDTLEKYFDSLGFYDVIDPYTYVEEETEFGWGVYKKGVHNIVIDDKSKFLKTRENAKDVVFIVIADLIESMLNDTKKLE
jgi:hypothetical protein